MLVGKSYQKYGCKRTRRIVRVVPCYSRRFQHANLAYETTCDISTGVGLDGCNFIGGHIA